MDLSFSSPQHVCRVQCFSRAPSGVPLLLPPRPSGTRSAGRPLVRAVRRLIPKRKAPTGTNSLPSPSRGGGPFSRRHRWGRTQDAFLSGHSFRHPERKQTLLLLCLASTPELFTPPRPADSPARREPLGSGWPGGLCVHTEWRLENYATNGVARTCSFRNACCSDSLQRLQHRGAG